MSIQHASQLLILYQNQLGKKSRAFRLCNMLQKNRCARPLLILYKKVSGKKMRAFCLYNTHLQTKLRHSVPRQYPGYEKTIREVQVLDSGLCIERIVFKVWIQRFKFQVLYSKFYIRGVLYSKVSIPGVYSKFHKNDPGRYSKIGFQDLYFECYIPSSVFEGCQP